MELKRNSPLAFGIAVALITVAILFVMSAKAQVRSDFAKGNDSGDLAKKAAILQKAPELSGISGYINAPDGFRLSDAKGKVILVDFWTYSCINCIRTLPYLTAWDEMYRDKGLVIIGVETPEFEFEKDRDNVQKAVRKFGIRYPVVQDNDYATWTAYGNRYWPHKYLIDSDGFIRYDHIGEGGYEETEQEIRKLLSERDNKTGMGSLVSGNVSSPRVDFTRLGTPEIYLGSGFARAPLGNPEGFSAGQVVSYALPPSVEPNLVYLEGSWKNNEDNMELVSDSGKIVLNFQAKNLNIVCGGDSTLGLKLDGSVPQPSQLGPDAGISDGSALAHTGDLRLYSLIDKADYSPQTLTIEVHGKGFRIYTFTFG
ncbi:MAG: thioredoxin family protein [Candidatus Micrarchaeia archaeon]